MKKIEMLFLAQRRRVKITPHIEELAKKDAEWFKELYIEAIFEKKEDDAAASTELDTDEIYELAVYLIKKYCVAKTSIPILKNQIEDYFEAINYSEKDPSIYEKCLITLKTHFKNSEWEEIKNKKDGYQRTLKWIYYRFSKQIKKDKDFPLEIIHEIYTKIKLSSRDINDVKPAYCKTICNNDDIDKKYNSPELNFSDMANEPDDDSVEFLSAIENLICNNPFIEKLYRPEQFAKALKLLLDLNDAQAAFVESMKDASYEYQKFKNYRTSEKKWREVERKLFARAMEIFMEKGYSAAYFYKAKERVLEKINALPYQSNAAKRELYNYFITDNNTDNSQIEIENCKIELEFNNYFMTFFTNENNDSNLNDSIPDDATNMDESEISGNDSNVPEEKTTLNKISSNNDKINLKAYRFSGQESLKINKLIKIFKNPALRDIKFEFDRLPEVYYDTYDNYVKIYGEIGDDEEDNHNNYENKITPDYLGVYCDFSLSGNDYETKEGVIVLFKDRIEKYSKVIEKKLRIKNAEDAIRIVVLMHELGHWICHWPIALNDNWNLSYYNKAAQYKRTHEALANLITYWAVNKDKVLSDVLEDLTPTKITDPYYLYKNLLKHQTQQEIIKKIVDLRKHFYLSDDNSYDYLELTTLPGSKDILHFIIERIALNLKPAIMDSFLFDNKNNKTILNSMIKVKKETTSVELMKFKFKLEESSMKESVEIINRVAPRLFVRIKMGI